MRRAHYIFLLLLTLTGLVAGCNNPDCGCDPQPGMADSQLMHTWRLDKISEGDQVVSAGAAIKDRYTLTFQAQDAYTQTLEATATTYTGTWKLINSGHNIKLTDHKGDVRDYSITGAWPNGGLLPGLIFLRRYNKDKALETWEFGLVP